MAAGYFDAHTHLDFPVYDDDRADVVARAHAAGVAEWIIAAADPAHWERVQRVAYETGGTAVIGVHPWWADTADFDDIASLHDEALVGECGLDFFRARDSDARERQRTVFEAHVALGVPLVLHCVRAYDELLRHDLQGGMVHGWSGSVTHVDRAIDKGLYLSFGMITARSPKVREALARVPDDRLLIETDCPGRGVPEPAALLRVADVVAEVRGVPAVDLLELTRDNARRFLGEVGL